MKDNASKSVVSTGPCFSSADFTTVSAAAAVTSIGTSLGFVSARTVIGYYFL